MEEYLPIPKKWQPLVAALEFTVRFATKAWTVQTESTTWEFGPYVQVQYVDDEVHAEITSNTYMRPKLSSEQEWMLHFLGWETYEDDMLEEYPNWTKIVPNTIDGHREVAELWVRSLIYIYGMDEKWRFRTGIVNPIFLNEWRRLMTPNRLPGVFQLKPFARRYTANSEKTSLEKARETASIIYGIECVFRDARKLKLYGTDLIRLASARQKPEVVKAITELVNAGKTSFGYYPSSEVANELGLYQDVEFDELAGQEFKESHKEDFN